MIVCIDGYLELWYPRGARLRISQHAISSIPFFPANKATAWPPCSWVELQAVLDRAEFWASQWLGLRHRKQLCTEKLQLAGAKVSTPRISRE
jgi:hypothetical protein